ncbi:protein arginine N-methyltransferase 9-like [Zerene cesonia]|uniref:protein arginine N-methyltransferase 9-like n=1 Tax=Zerene cesonia TaxID=33412 RepID=UPI0018E4E240|nr:protein arginine N-methyltransferase 9-like [Zerene cesonia]
MSGTQITNAREFIDYARQLSSNECYAKAFDMYLMAFEKNPDLKNLYEREFRSVINKLNEMLAAGDKIDDIFCNFSRAIYLFPGNMYLLNEVGKYLYKFGYYSEAWFQFQKALKVDAGFVNAEKNLNSVKNLLVERWHFKMLNDKIRNESYRAAIHDLISRGKDTVLDVGSGTGLLSLYASECNPKFITACDSSEVMANISNAVLNDNSVKNEFSVVNRISTSLNHFDIGGRLDVLVTELFDAGLFGEHILTALSHAWQNLLHQEAKVLPASAEFYVMGVECQNIIDKYQLCQAAKDLLNIPSLNVHVFQFDETYDCEDINLFKTLKYMTEPKCLMTVDFNDPNSIEDKLKNTEPYITQLAVNQNGELSTIIGWFNLNLSEKYQLTTDPRSDTRATAWDQAIFFDHIPKKVNDDQRLVYKFTLQSGKIALVQDCNLKIIRVTLEILRFLNDIEFMKKIMSCLGLACVYLGQLAEISDMCIADLSPFPMFGLQMLKRGAKSLVCCVKSEEDKQFFDEVFKSNDIDISRITYLFGTGWNKDSFNEDKYHAIFCNILEVAGDIDLRYRDISQYLRQNHLHPGGLFLPSKITLMAQIARCDWFDVHNRVDDRNVSNYKIAAHINKYQASQNFCLDFSLLDYTPLSEPVDLGECVNMASDVINVAIIKTEDANSILCWYNVELMENMGEISTKRSCSFIDGTAFLADPHIFMKKGDIANILHCVDTDGSFKLMLDVEAT